MRPAIAQRIICNNIPGPPFTEPGNMGRIAGTISAEPTHTEVAVESPRKRSRVPKGMWLRGRTWWYRVTAPDGRRRQISLGTHDLPQAKQYRAVLEQLSDPRAKAADLVQRVFDGSLSVPELYDAHVRGEIKQLRSGALDPDLSTHIAGWLEWLEKRRKVSERQREDYLRQVRTLIPEGKVFRRSKLTAKAIENWLTNLDADSSSTQARYFAALRSFVKYLRVQGVIDGLLIEAVEPPRNAASRDGFMPFEQVKRVLAAMPEGDSRALVALAFGSGMERIALLKLTAADVIDAQNRTLLAPGTKNASRNRYVVVDQWAWPYVEGQLKGKIGQAPLFSLRYEDVLDDFYSAQIAVGVAAALPEGITPRNAGKKGISVRGHFHTLHDCRHTYAVNRMTGDDGEPTRDLQFIADQLGHTDLQMVSRIYARHRHRLQVRAEQRHQGANTDNAPPQQADANQA